MRIVGRCLIEIFPFVLQRTVHLIRGNMQELLVWPEASVRQLPCRLRRVQHHQRAEHICAHKHLRIFNAAVDMALRRKMYHAVDIIFLENLCDRRAVRDIRLYKRIIFTLLHITQILQIARVCQAVYVDNADFVVIFLKHIMNIIGTDKACAPGNKIRSHDFPPFLMLPVLLCVPCAFFVLTHFSPTHHISIACR